jgi:S-adenosylmethionine-diacylglycerol 3-amino-3-carboxypropyl transferase
MALSQLKLQLLTSANLEERLALLGHIPMDSEKRKQGLEKRLAKSGFYLDVLGPADIISSIGPDFAGRYEFLFARLREVLGNVGQALGDLLALEDVEAQSQRVAPTSSLGMALDTTFEEVMSLPNLMSLFGRDATGNRYQEFSHHFAWRTRSIISTLPAATNPYLSQMLLGRFQSSVYFPWLMAEKIKKRLRPYNVQKWE